MRAIYGLVYDDLKVSRADGVTDGDTERPEREESKKKTQGKPSAAEREKGHGHLAAHEYGSRPAAAAAATRRLADPGGETTPRKNITFNSFRLPLIFRYFPGAWFSPALSLTVSRALSPAADCRVPAARSLEIRSGPLPSAVSRVLSLFTGDDSPAITSRARATLSCGCRRVANDLVVAMVRPSGIRRRNRILRRPHCVPGPFC